MEQHIKNLIWLAFAGLCGSFVGLRLRKEKSTSIYDRVTYVLSGLLVAFFVTPFLLKWFHVKDIDDIRALTFVAGVFWTKILERFRLDIEGKNNIAGGEVK